MARGVPGRVARTPVVDQTRVVDKTPAVDPEHSVPSDAELSSVAGQLDTLLERIGELVAACGVDDRSGDVAGLLEVDRHLRGARRELGRTRRRLR